MGQFDPLPCAAPFAGYNRRVQDRVSQLLSGISLDGVGLEIGPLASPLVARAEGRRIYYADYANQDELRRRSKNNPAVDLDAIPTIDFVIGSLADYDRIGMRFDYIIASHVIEHTPDFVGWLNKLLSLLHPGIGRLVLAVPDKRYCFDYFRSLSTLGDALEAYRECRSKPSFRQIFDGASGARTIDTIACWQGRFEDAKPWMPPERAMMLATKSTEEGRYADVHCWVWTFESFMQMLMQLIELNVLSAKIVRTTAPQHYWNEFHIVLAT